MYTTKDLRKRRKAAGLCTECGSPAREGKTYCADCAAKKAAFDRRRYERECAEAGRDPAAPGKRGTPNRYEYIAWDGRNIVVRGTGAEVAAHFGTTDRYIWYCADRGIRIRRLYLIERRRLDDARTG